ncbi:MAG TPA: hypothetical protein VH583_08085 [Vicinamibacterales bacterium]|jgi:hypothetical protein
MASIAPVTLQIFLNNPSEGMALIQVSYKILPTLDDVSAGRTYRELVQLISKPRGIERLVPGGTMWDGTVVFTGGGFNRLPELLLPIAALRQGVISPLQSDPIIARVTLTPLPATVVTQQSNTVDVDPTPVNA